MSSRISSKHNSGSGDTGYSLLLDGHSIRKNDPACWIYAEVEKAINTISKLLITEEVVSPQLLSMLEFLQQNLFSLSSFCFCKGKTTKFALTTNYISELDKAIVDMKFFIGNATDFIWYSDAKSIALDSIRIIIRDVERAFTAWRFHPTILEYIVELVSSEPLLAQSIAINIKTYASFLNRLSTYLWWATRYENIYSTKDENYWSGSLNLEPASNTNCVNGETVDEKVRKRIKQELLENFPNLVFSSRENMDVFEIDKHTKIAINNADGTIVVNSNSDEARLAWIKHFKLEKHLTSL